ncbi:MAG: hypothetical protein IM583_15370 [Pseudanabaena sp. M114S2SP2A07QC]|nr:hypothetical protein [Pseudanabaena sp. M090S1SP2A07QC]MCA6505798.1 hypothetical protein [Pseudanabaena sp. M172S2SP2A07QC]MCA6524157.1 hypothetical protein [Pseudanabaena sp. M051S1SP2A07QC]MCA6524561.1 hypothetical protein [Pseudanabaena sp. M179S2SP2A07QC]MCA6534502.1 hypothetical protein [Pseudanabaena sp. M176S2SP2A07QC]MCA6538886.1 hypothetical protein [Pseudanabaena sp. M037S2SP2A07QC]MCA6557960.1 hypothetical protein [Pseudanabaena sp. M114S2SP2A07QC]MCA6560285.1 hypothetical prot
MAEQSSAIFWVLNCPIYLLRCYIAISRCGLVLDLWWRGFAAPPQI